LTLAAKPQPTKASNALSAIQKVQVPQNIFENTSPEIKPAQKPPTAFEEPAPPPRSAAVLSQKEKDEMMWDTKFLVENAEDPEEMEKAEVRDKKYKQALMKNKQLLVMLEKERTMRIKHEKDLKEYQAVLNTKQVEESTPKPAGDEADWKAKSQKYEKKLNEERLKAGLMKSDLEKALRIIKREVGEFENLDKLASNENGWKGRAQEIEVLKAKLKDYQNLNKTAGPSDRLYTIKK